MTSLADIQNELDRRDQEESNARSVIQDFLTTEEDRTDIRAALRAAYVLPYEDRELALEMIRNR